MRKVRVEVTNLGLVRDIMNTVLFRLATISKILPPPFYNDDSARICLLLCNLLFTSLMDGTSYAFLSAFSVR